MEMHEKDAQKFEKYMNKYGTNLKRISKTKRYRDYALKDVMLQYLRTISAGIAPRNNSRTDHQWRETERKIIKLYDVDKPMRRISWCITVEDRDGTIANHNQVAYGSPSNERLKLLLKDYYYYLKGQLKMVNDCFELIEMEPAVFSDESDTSENSAEQNSSDLHRSNPSATVGRMQNSRTVNTGAQYSTTSSLPGVTNSYVTSTPHNITFTAPSNTSAAVSRQSTVTTPSNASVGAAVPNAGVSSRNTTAAPSSASIKATHSSATNTSRQSATTVPSNTSAATPRQTPTSTPSRATANASVTNVNTPRQNTATVGANAKTNTTTTNTSAIKTSEKNKKRSVADSTAKSGLKSGPDSLKPSVTAGNSPTNQTHMKVPLNRHETEEAKVEKAISGEAVKNDQILAKESEIASLLRMSRENGNGKS